MWRLLALLALAYVPAYASQQFVTCKRDYHKIGCFKEVESRTLMTTMLVNDRDASSSVHQGHILDWEKFKESMHSLACRCSEKAKNLGFKYFSIRFYGECHGGKDTALFNQLVQDQSKRSAECVNSEYKTCKDVMEGECAGKDWADYIFEIKAKGPQSVDGGYSDWSEWSSCSKSCGYGVQVRERACTNPVPQGEGKDCSGQGSTTEHKKCILKHCPVNGGFTAWSGYSHCTKSCGGGTQSKSRSCTNPRPQHGGKDCNGPTTESRRCNSHSCSVDGRYTEWSCYSECSKSCGGGLQTRSRTCSNPKPSHGGRDCSGPSRQRRRCNIEPCELNGGYTKWSSYSKCTKSCGGGIQTRTRSCTNPRPSHGGKGCVGPAKQSKRCNTHACPATTHLFRICEHHNGAILKCPFGRAINIVRANYGRKSSHFCGYRPHYNLRCGSGVSTSRVRSRCQGQNSCYLVASNGIFGDPCVYTVKYLEVHYQCVLPRTHVARVCEHRNGIKLGCPTGTVLKITHANYGRLSASFCRFGNHRLTSCRARNSVGKVAANCNNKQTCYVVASNGIFGDPCVGTVKYLEVHYRCIPRPTHLSLVCEHHPGQQISCPHGYAINIRGANYGRYSISYCRWGNHNHFGCRSGHSLNRVRSECQGKRNCFVLASNGIFGDPCLGIVKYLEVQYQCVPAVERQSLVCEHRAGTKLSCPITQRLHVTYANYGRLSISYCRFNNHNHWGCRARNSLQKTRQMCENRHQCDIAARNGIYGDPCVGIVKYLDARYQCIPSVVHHAIWCEHRAGGRIGCPRGQRIHITYANYGRLSIAYCKFGNHMNWGCRAGSSLHQVKRRCEGKQACHLQATNGIFGDPCWGIVKYLEVKYVCY